MWTKLGAKHNRTDIKAAGATLTKQAPLLLHDIQVAMARSVVGGVAKDGNRREKPTEQNPSTIAEEAEGPPCHPYVAGEQSCSDMSKAGAHVSGTIGR